MGSKKQEIIAYPKKKKKKKIPNGSSLFGLPCSQNKLDLKEITCLKRRLIVSQAAESLFTAESLPAPGTPHWLSLTSDLPGKGTQSFSMGIDIILPLL